MMTQSKVTKPKRNVVARHALLALFMLLPMAACDDGMDSEEATEICQRNREVLAACFDDAVYAQCVSCHEDCGRDCSLVDSARCGWVCPD